MKLKLAIALSAAGLFLSIAGAQALTVSNSDKMPALRCDAVKVGCAGGRRCRGWFVNGQGRRVCRGWIACR